MQSTAGTFIRTPDSELQTVLIRSRRRSLLLRITPAGHLQIRAPHSLSEKKIWEFVSQKKDWIEKRAGDIRRRIANTPAPPSAEEEKRLKLLARDAFIERACLFAEKMGVTFRNIRLSSAKTRWGSCGPQGDLNFHWRLIQTPIHILDYVVIHELAHLVEPNHSPRFWAKVAEHCPDFKAAKRWLKENHHLH